MEPFDHLGSHHHHVVALFDDVHIAEGALRSFDDDGADTQVSVLIRHGDESALSADSGEKARDVAAGTALGGLAGFVGGALLFGIPGVGTVIGAGLWAATLVGASLGATAGIEISDYHHSWEGQYRRAVEEGRTLVAISTNDPLVAAAAVDRFRSADALQVDHFDRNGTQLLER